MTRPMPESWRRTALAVPDPLTATASWSAVIELHPEAWRVRAFSGAWTPEDPVA